MNEKTLKFDNVEVNVKGFHISKQPIALNLVNVSQILTSQKFSHSDTSFKYFIGYKDDNIVSPLCIILPQMSGYYENHYHISCKKDALNFIQTFSKIQHYEHSFDKFHKGSY